MLARLGIIALVFGLTVSLGQAQEQAEDPSGSAANQQNPAQTFPVPLPVDIVEDQATAEARQRSEEEAREREIRDLAAQEGMNAATQSIEVATRDMRDYALYSTILVALGTFMLGITLWLTRQANRAAQHAVEVTREMGQAQVRAYVTIDSVSACVDGQNRPVVEVSIRNNGASPSKNTRIVAQCDIGVAGVVPDGFDHFHKDAHRVVNSGSQRLKTEIRACLPFDAASGDEVRRTLAFEPLQDAIVAELTSPPSLFEATIEIQYTDVFGVEHIEPQNFMAIAPPGQGWQEVKALDRFEVGQASSQKQG